MRYWTRGSIVQRRRARSDSDNDISPPNDLLPTIRRMAPERQSLAPHLRLPMDCLPLFSSIITCNLPTKILLLFRASSYILEWCCWCALGRLFGEKTVMHIYKFVYMVYIGQSCYPHGSSRFILILEAFWIEFLP